MLSGICVTWDVFKLWEKIFVQHVLFVLCQKKKKFCPPKKVSLHETESGPIPSRNQRQNNIFKPKSIRRDLIKRNWWCSSILDLFFVLVRPGLFFYAFKYSDVHRCWKILTDVQICLQILRYSECSDFMISFWSIYN